MLTDFAQIFIDIYEHFISPDFLLKDWFESIIILVVETTAIVGALLFGAVSINAMFSVFRTK